MNSYTKAEEVGTNEMYFTQGIHEKKITNDKNIYSLQSIITYTFRDCAFNYHMKQQNFFFILQIRKLELMLVHMFPKSACLCAKSLQSCLTLCDPMDCSLPVSSDQGILQERTLEWVALPSSRGYSWCRDRTWVSLCLLHWQAGSIPLASPGSIPKSMKANLLLLFSS